MGAKARRTLSLGEKVRKYRAQNGLTLARLSELSGISISTLSKLENGQTSLNLRSVIQLSEGLLIPVTALISDDDGSGTGGCKVSRNGEASVHRTPQLDFMVLCSDLPSQHNVFWKVRVKARSLAEFGAYRSHPGEEFFLVLEGTVDFRRWGRKPVRLRTGDSVHFDSAVGHAYLAAGGSPALILMSNTISDPKAAGFANGQDGIPVTPARRAAAARTRAAVSRRSDARKAPRLRGTAS